tara:strand:- start:93 stop:581 length:489 start_codon:yes stop_codon:yes gene_type:complete
MKTLILISIIIASTAHGITREDLIQKVSEVTPNISVRAYDLDYASHTSKSFSKTRVEYQKLLHKASVNKFFKKPVFDCEDYARLFRVSSSLQIIRDNLNYACGTIMVRQTSAFGGVPSVGNAVHMLNIVLLNDELVIVEPQSLKSVPLVDYVNKDSIMDISF